MNQQLKPWLLTALLWNSTIFIQACVVAKTNSQFTSRPTSATQFDEQTLARQLASSYLNKQPITANTANLSLEQALKVQNQFVQILIPNLGKVVGYKAALTNPTIQKRFQVSHPVSGVLLEKMLLKTGATIPSDFGTQPRLEGDLIVRVKSEAINTATTPQAALAALDVVIPFIELPDIVYAKDVRLNASSLVAINAGARLGILGEPIPLTPTQAWQERLGKIKLVIFDGTGKQLAVGESQAILGHPLQAVLWLKDNLKTQGKSLKKGDLLSLGSITPMLSVKSATKVRARYLGLDPKGKVEIFVSFPD
ncbi:hypothetical protein [Chlorogloeopsis sp. ULAP02]|uniref:2-keto-4-pentenoate hydratase n=1 Tax=Chlorogloeopsis sp. ULAP02 TaxID=3107926 RepID=UPI0031360AF8